MGNMGYCRFRNTLSDLRDCKEALEELFEKKGDDDTLNREEEEAAKQLVATCIEIVGLVAEYESVDVDDVSESHIDEAITTANEIANERDKKKMEEEDE
jgi:hypothetical protein